MMEKNQKKFAKQAAAASPAPAPAKPTDVKTSSAADDHEALLN
jgi:hypothetical protein